MRDRQPTQPGRVLLTPENGEAPFYATMEMADEPTDPGTPPTKENLLRDDTEIALFGDAADRTVDDAFRGIGFKFSMLSSNMATCTMTVKDTAGKPVPGVVISGIFNESGGAVMTNASGVASGYVSAGSVTLAVKNYADLLDATDATFEAVAGGAYTRSLTVTRRTYLKLTSSKNLMFSGSVDTVDVALINGGQGGAKASPSVTGDYGDSYTPAYGGRGGDGGGFGKQTGLIPTPGTSYPAVVGSAGAAGGYQGGASSFMGVIGTGNTGVGGSGATSIRAGTARDAAAGGNSAATLYASETTEEAVGGGGGGGGAQASASSAMGGAKGGTPHGGAGASFWPRTAAVAGKTGAGAGGGGGAVEIVDLEDNRYDIHAEVLEPARGGSGCITMRIHLKAA